ncbi:CCR4-associated factor 1 11 [Tripterygium wilfordii]|uniref:poly(A)-specific ribonuclease n=1 Tax=Tripterygium wilfordii TaxID=458696 RepID=A0A7J7CXY9_TRIWF|nr:probable CCR4-associated factor 1 homolog 11 [Tripterygium wilfordii]KAF5738930.1 CCR4-associated factor 1 11 [Tripterygium wilfordii]
MAVAISEELMATSSTKPVMVKEVWAGNLEFELRQIRQIIPYYPVVTIDTEFPGTIYKADRDKISNNPSYNYAFMKANVDELNIIQLGLTLSDEYGNLPDFGSACSYIWEFNFCDFDIDQDPHDQDSIELLKRQGINFRRNKEEGVDSMEFSRLLFEYEIVSENLPLAWLTFHGAYDFGFLVKILSAGQELPSELDCFIEELECYLGDWVYDMKVVSKSYNLYGGLEKMAKELGVERIAGKSHQAGSDSLLTMQTFMRLQEHYSSDDISDLNEFGLLLYGLEVPNVSEFRRFDGVPPYPYHTGMIDLCPVEINYNCNYLYGFC